MKNLKWGTPEKLRELVCELVSWKSITLSDGELAFPIKLAEKFKHLEYFRKNPEHLSLHQADLGRQFLTALYKHPEATDTICLISHFDTVNTEEYGDLQQFSTEPEKLTRLFLEQHDDFTEDALKDLESGEYLFGRGIMDMKMGLAIHMRILEKASIENWPINLLLLTVPDEEVNSTGMRCAVPVLLRLQEQHDLMYTLFLNGEPVFSQKPADPQYYIYTGTIGKIMPAALFYGKETHVGEPFGGMTSPFIASFLTQKMEWNDVFQETVLGEKTPAPVTLQQKDLKLEYSTQTPYRSTALYNVFLMKRNASEIMDLFERVANEAANDCNTVYLKSCQKHQVEPIGKVRVIRYQDLLKYANDKFGSEYIEEMKKEIHANQEWDDREKSFRITDKLMILCQELSPSIVILYAPPFYPAVNSTGNEFVEECVSFMTEKAKENYHLSVKRIHYFNGICDLSYVNYRDLREGWTTFEMNTPVWGDSYVVPFKGMEKLNAPVLNVGPFGKDAHKRTERLHIRNAFEEIPCLVEEMVYRISSKKIAADWKF